MKKKTGPFKKLFILTGIAILIGVSIGSYIAVAKGVPSIKDLRHHVAVTGTRIYADDDTLIGELKVEKGIYLPLKAIPKDLINAVVAVEDSRFWKHKGFDHIAILRAAIKDILHVRIKEGGSTITQQLAKITFLTPEKTLTRKIKEIALARKIEKSLTKEEILELYLNRIYLGHGAYGVEMAARVYFGKSARNLNLSESALLAGLIKAPSIYSPYNNLVLAKDRQKTVLQRMEEEGYIKPSEREKAERQPLQLATLRGGVEANNYFIEYIRRYLEEKYGEDMVYKGGLKVYTTLDRKAQMAAARALQVGLREIDKRKGWRGPIENRKIDAEKELEKKKTGFQIPDSLDITTGIVLKVSHNEAIIKARGVNGRLSIENARWASNIFDPRTGKTTQIKNFSLDKILKVGDIVKVKFISVKGNKLELALEQDPLIEGAIVAIDPYTGFIRALIGGYDYSRSEFNRALYAKRQPGSAFKPVIYAAALDSGFTPASIITDEPVTYPGGPRGEWSPENYDHKFYGPTRLRDALAYSRNVVTVKLLESVGVNRVIEFARRLGIEGNMPNDLSLALGSMTTTPFELCSAYTVFANGGVRMKPLAIKYITNARGSVIESNEPEGEQVISPEVAFLITSMMEDVVNYGTGWRVKALGRPVAGKTGTTNDYRDAWFAGYTSDIVACVWVGFDDMKPLGHQETGAKAASPIWLNFVRSIDSGDPVGFPVPEGIVSYYIDPSNGLLVSDPSQGIKEYFRRGNEPKEYSNRRSIIRNLIEIRPDYD